jgi:hypothetical protein
MTGREGDGVRTLRLRERRGGAQGRTLLGVDERLARRLGIWVSFKVGWRIGTLRDARAVTKASRVAPLIARDQRRRADDRICFEMGSSAKLYPAAKRTLERTGNEVIAPPSRERPCEAHVAHLHRSRPRREHLVPGALGIARKAAKSAMSKSAQARD